MANGKSLWLTNMVNFQMLAEWRNIRRGEMKLTYCLRSILHGYTISGAHKAGKIQSKQLNLPKVLYIFIIKSLCLFETEERVA